MGKNHRHNHDHEPEAADNKALRHVEDARASYAKAEERVAALRARLTRAEEKLVRRTARLGKAEDALAALAHEHADVPAEQRDPDTAVAMADSNGATTAHADDAGTTGAAAPAPDTVQLSVQAIDDLAPVTVTTGDGANGTIPRRSRSRRASSTTDEV